MLLEQITELRIIDVLDRNIPNKECIAISVEAPVNIGQYGLFLGFSNVCDGLALPIRDNFFWFGESFVNRDDWIFVYTGSGQPRKALSSNGQSWLHSLYWNRPQTLFNNSNVVPVLFKIGAVQVSHKAKALPQV